MFSKKLVPAALAAAVSSIAAAQQDAPLIEEMYVGLSLSNASGDLLEVPDDEHGASITTKSNLGILKSELKLFDSSKVASWVKTLMLE